MKQSQGISPAGKLLLAHRILGIGRTQLPERSNEEIELSTWKRQTGQGKRRDTAPEKPSEITPFVVETIRLSAVFGYQKAGLLALATSIFLPQTEPREASMTKLIGQV